MDPIDGIRAFNRTHSVRMGLLRRSYLDGGVGLTEARLLWEIGAAEAARLRGDAAERPSAGTLARRLAIDEAQTSRALAALVRRGWIAREPTGDARRQALRLTDEGGAAWIRFEAASRAAIEALLAPLSEAQRAALADHLVEADAILSAGARPAAPVSLRAPRPGDLGWVVERHGALYAEEFGYDTSFEGVVAEIVAGFAARGDTARERGWIAVECERPGAARIGSAFVMAEGAREPDVARLRLVLVEPAARGRGVGRRLLETALAFARAAGYRRMRLWTHREHEAAGRLYARHGFTLVSSSVAQAFGKRVTDETWERLLEPEPGSAP